MDYLPPKCEDSATGAAPSAKAQLRYIQKTRCKMYKVKSRVFIEGIPPHVMDAELLVFLQRHGYGEATDCVIQRDSNTGRSFCTAFVGFRDREEASRLAGESGRLTFEGHFLRMQVRSGPVSPHPNTAVPSAAQIAWAVLHAGGRDGIPPFTNVSPNSTIFVPGIPDETSEADLYDFFSRTCGRIASVRVLKTRQCAFVTFYTRSAARYAIARFGHPQCQETEPQIDVVTAAVDAVDNYYRTVARVHGTLPLIPLAELPPPICSSPSTPLFYQPVLPSSFPDYRMIDPDTLQRILRGATAIAEQAAMHAHMLQLQPQRNTTEASIPTSMTPYPCNDDPERCVHLPDGTLMTISWGNSQTRPRTDSCGLGATPVLPLQGPTEYPATPLSRSPFPPRDLSPPSFVF